VGAAGAVPVVAWARRRAPSGPGVAIRGRKYPVLDGAREGEIDPPADAVAGAGCDESGCYAAALIRPAEGDGGAPEAIAGFRYPR
jgi:hypothetical protein